MERVTDFRVDTIELALADYQRLESAKKLTIGTYGAWLTTPRQAALTDGIVRFEMPAYRWDEINDAH